MISRSNGATTNGGLAVPHHLLEAIAPVLEERRAVLAELDELAAMRDEINRLSQRAGGRGPAPTVEVPANGGRAALLESLERCRQLEAEIDDLRRAGTNPRR